MRQKTLRKQTENFRKNFISHIQYMYTEYLYLVWTYLNNYDNFSEIPVNRQKTSRIAQTRKAKTRHSDSNN
jgi:hypothetical protein